MDIAIYKFNSDTDTLPTFNDGYSYTYTDVDNGDGTITRTITSDNLPTSISFSYKDGLVSLSYLNTSNVTDMTEMFNRCSNLTSIDVSSFDTSKVTNMSGMFHICSKLTSIDVSSFDTSKVTDMEDMFWSCGKLTSIKGLNNWDTKNVTTIAGIFSYCYSLTSSLDLSSWNTSSMTNIRYLAASCSLSSINLSGWDTSKVIHMDRMFEFSDLTELNLSGWDTSSVRYFTDMFKYVDSLKTVIMKDSDAESINDIIHQLLARTADSPGLILVGKDMDTSLIDTTSANEKYLHVVQKEYRVADFTFNSDTDTLPTFNSDFTYDCIDSDGSSGIITRTIVSNELPTSISFAYKTGLVSLSYLNTSNITNMGSMFSNCENMTSIDLSSFDTSKATNMSQLFYKCMKLTTIEGLNNLNTNQVTDISHMFNRCYELTSLDLSSFNTSKVTKMCNMFQECNTLITIKGLNTWNTSNVTDISYMFDGCIELIELNLINFNTSKVTTMYSIFQNCKKLRTLNINNFNINDTANTGWMFYNCESLISVNMEDSDTNTINSIIPNLPTRSSNNKGTLTVPNPKDNAINISSAQSKYWNLEATPQYAFDINTITYFISKIKEKFAAISDLKNKVDKEEGKNLSTNNFSNEEKDHIENSFNDVTLVDNILVFYSTSESGDKVIVETFDLDI